MNPPPGQYIGHLCPTSTLVDLTVAATAKLLITGNDVECPQGCQRPPRIWRNEATRTRAQAATACEATWVGIGSSGGRESYKGAAPRQARADPPARGRFKAWSIARYS